MIPYPYNMVDMGGIDLAEANGTVVEGLYAKIVEALDACGDVVLYNWKFAGIEIAPQHTQILVGSGELRINTLIQVTEQDEVTVLGIEPPIEPVEPLDVSENGTYAAEPPISGFNPVRVAVPIKTLAPLVAQENGQYSPEEYGVDGFSLVNVNVQFSGVQVEPYEGYTYPSYISVRSSTYFRTSYRNDPFAIYKLDPGTYYCIILNPSSPEIRKASVDCYDQLVADYATPGSGDIASNTVITSSGTSSPYILKFTLTAQSVVTVSPARNVTEANRKIFIIKEE